MSVAFEKMPGVARVEVSLEEGTVRLYLEPDNRITLDQVREVIKENGFTAKQAVVAARGKIIERGGRPALQLAGLPQVLLLEGRAPSSGENVMVHGTVQVPGRGDPERLKVQSVENPR